MSSLTLDDFITATHKMRQIRQQSILNSLSVVSDLTKKYLSFLAGDDKQQHLIALCRMSIKVSLLLRQNRLILLLLFLNDVSRWIVRILTHNKGLYA